MNFPERESAAQECKKTLEHLKRLREPYEAEIDEVIKFVDPSLRQITDETKGKRTGKEKYDGTAVSALNMLVDGMVGYLCSQNLRWFRFTLPVKFAWRNGVNQRLDEIHEVKLWLQECEEVQYSAFNRSNFYDQITNFIRGGGGIGTSHMIAEEEMGEGKIYFTVPHFRECYFAENRFGKVDVHFRKFKMTLRQLVDQFGRELMDSIDINFTKDYNNDPFIERPVIHAIFPRKDRDISLKNSINKPIASQWIYCDKDMLLKESGYDSMPVITWRWRKNSDELCGRSPAWDAMVDIKLANQQGRTNLTAGHMMVRPPMVGPSMIRGAVNMAPESWTWLDGDLERLAPRPMLTGIQLPYAIEMQREQRQIIRDHFAVDFFLMLSQAAMQKTELTATQVIEMMGEKAAVLGTRIGMLQSEGLDPVHDRVFDIEMRAGRMPPPPAIVQEAMAGDIKVEYLGPLAQAQKFLTKTRSMRSGLQIITEMAQVSPAVLDNFDFDEMARDMPDTVGYLEKYIRDRKSVADIRKTREEQEQAAQQAQALPELAKAFRFLGIKSDEGSVADQLTGGKQ